jgi:hypothetical protein
MNSKPLVISVYIVAPSLPIDMPETHQEDYTEDVISDLRLTPVGWASLGRGDEDRALADLIARIPEIEGIVLADEALRACLHWPQFAELAAAMRKHGTMVYTPQRSAPFHQQAEEGFKLE